MNAPKRLRSEKSNAEIKVARTSNTQSLNKLMQNSRVNGRKSTWNCCSRSTINLRSKGSREYRESESRFLNTLQAKFDAMNTEIHNLTKRVRELKTKAKEVNTLKQQVCVQSLFFWMLNWQQSAMHRRSRMLHATCAGMVYRKSRAKI